MKTKRTSLRTYALLNVIALVGVSQVLALPRVHAQSTVYNTVLGETNPITPEINTEQLEKILADRSGPVLDVRFAKEYAIAHIPGSINIYEKEIETITQRFPDKTTPIVLYCNGPFCGKSKRLSGELAKLGYTNVKRYQLGLPIWRALGRTVQTDLPGIQYVVDADKTAVFVDARSRGEFEQASMPGSVNIVAGEAEQANEPADGRLPHKDKGTRVIVFASDPKDARKVAEEIAKKAYWNSSYFGGTTDELKAKGLWQQKKSR
ncbi:MAG TPA: rhodanese-like domain-containing protein [Candidatus Udaeobacter sp.]|jgi:rhodanese-related sulfurtransferase|nr:rhodanese-like domain-containing protein [Candidatus Udaeobacter sp.]